MAILPTQQEMQRMKVQQQKYREKRKKRLSQISQQIFTRIGLYDLKRPTLDIIAITMVMMAGQLAQLTLKYEQLLQTINSVRLKNMVF